MTTCRTSLSDDSIDLLDVAGEDGVLFDHSDGGLAGRGVALRMEIEFTPPRLATALQEVTEALQGFSGEGESPVAFVSIPFTNSRPILAVVPEVTVRRRSGRPLSITTIGDAPPPERFVALEPVTEPHTFEITPARPAKEWVDAVEEATTRLARGDLAKVVLAREIVVEADAAFSQYGVLRRLRTAYPTAMRFALDGFIGASPELLVERHGEVVTAEPMAGTAARSSDPGVDEALRTGLLESHKDRSEHRYLVDMVRETLDPLCRELVVPSVPSVVSLANVHHLATPVRGTLRSATSVLDLVAQLHPTPAVGGRPTAAASSLIEELEDLDRGRYAGAIGWVDADGHGRFAVAIRCAQLEGTRARVYAGSGIVAQSDPRRELAETQAKLQAMLSALIRP